MYNPADMREGYAVSAVLHGLLILVLIFGLPDFLRHHPPEEQPIAVQLVNVSDLTRALRRNKHPVAKARIDAPPTDNPSPKPKPPKPAPPPPPVPPPSAEPAPSTPQPQPQPAPQPTPPAPQPAPPRPEPKPHPQPQPKPAPEPQKQVAVAQAPKPPKPKKPKAADAAFDNLLKNLSKQAATMEKQDKPPKPRKDEEEPEDEPSAAPDAPLGSQLTTSQIDMIREQFERCWYVPAGARDAQDLQVEIKVQMNPDGSVNSARIIDSGGKYGRDSFWTAAADSALRAVRAPECSKLNVPLDKYDAWKNLDLFFDPKDLS